MSEKKFWNSFYTKNNKQTFEWLINYDDFVKNLNLNEFNTNANRAFLLDAGCGTSIFSSKLRDSLRDESLLICADFSREALEFLKQKQNNSSYIDHVQCNCKYLPFRNDLFDLIIDKGYLDSVLKSPKPDSIKNALECFNSLLNKLDYSDKLYKKFLLEITDETPELRISLYDQYSNSNQFSYFFKEIHIGNDLYYYAYFVYKINI